MSRDGDGVKPQGMLNRDGNDSISTTPSLENTSHRKSDHNNARGVGVRVATHSNELTVNACRAAKAPGHERRFDEIEGDEKTRPMHVEQIGSRLDMYLRGDHRQSQVFGSILWEALRTFFNGLDVLHTGNTLFRVKNIGEGCNGIAKRLTLANHGVLAYVTLKFTKPVQHDEYPSDNLLYEYRVGQYVNKVMHRFPCFARTYQVYRVTSKGYKRICTCAHTKRDELKNMLSHFADPFPRTLESKYAANTGCIEKAGLIALLTDHFLSCVSLSDFLGYADDTNPNKKLVYQNLLQILYQIYFPLSKLQDTFTHYDLHSKNVLLFPVPGVAGQPGHITFEYGDGEEKITFNCSYVAKIIDYARSFYHIDDSTNSAKDIMNVVEGKEDSFNPRDYGFQFFRQGDKYVHGIDSTRPNRTHDLRLLRETLSYMYSKKVGVSVLVAQSLATLKGEVHYYDNKDGHRTSEVVGAYAYGAPERLTCATDTKELDNNIICNVSAAEKRIREEILRLNSIKLKLPPLSLYNPFPFNQEYCYGKLTCSGERPVEFVREQRPSHT